jgi:type VI secretion system secreted protein Hcp
MIEKKILNIAVITAVITITIFTTTAFGATNSNSEITESFGYVKFDGLDGEATEPNHRDWSDIYGFNQHVTREIIPGSSQPGPLVFNPFVIHKNIDKSTPKIQEALSRGTIFPKVDVHITADYTSGGKQTYYAYEFKDAYIVDYKANWDASSDNIPNEEISILFEEIRVTYIQYGTKGAVVDQTEYAWNVVANSPR